MEEQPSIQQFYADRRNRKMTDPMIVHELEAGGWSRDDAAVAVASSKRAFTSSTIDPTFYTSKPGEISYTIPRLRFVQFTKKHGLQIVSFGALVFISGFLETRSRAIMILLIPMAIFAIFLSWVYYFLKNLHFPMQVTLQNDRLIISRRKGVEEKFYAKYGGIQLPENQKPIFAKISGEQTAPRGPISTIAFLEKRKALLAQEPATAFTLDIPPQHYAEIKAFLLARFAEHPTTLPPPTTPKKLYSPFYIGIFIAICALTLIGAIVFLFL